MLSEEKSAAWPSASVAMKAETTPARMIDGRPIRIVVVDDDQALLAMTARTLRRLGYEVTAFDRPLDALQHIEECGSPPNMLLTDAMMPRLTGPQLAAAVRVMLPDMPVALYSGHSRGELRELGHDLDTLWFIAKPYRPHQLASLIEQALQTDKG